MKQTKDRQEARNRWIRVLDDAWSSLDIVVQENCLSPGNLNRWWPGTQPTDTELMLREDLQS